MEVSIERETHPFDLKTEVQRRRESDRVPLSSLKKRGFDLVVAGLVTTFILLWLFPIVALLIRLTSKGPVLFVQMRNGHKGTIFPCLKFRTMAYERDAPFRQATVNDLRVTRVGRFLRRTNLDEMPQFLNVLAGHMSVVGPRPHPLPLDAEHWYSLPGYKDRYLVKPGITGLAQVRGARGETTELHKMKIRVMYDHLYIRRQSTRLDAKICWWTIKSTVKGDKNAL